MGRTRGHVRNAEFGRLARFQFEHTTDEKDQRCLHQSKRAKAATQVALGGYLLYRQEKLCRVDDFAQLDVRMVLQSHCMLCLSARRS